jgi:hypothetical protein
VPLLKLPPLLPSNLFQEILERAALRSGFFTSVICMILQFMGARGANKHKKSPAFKAGLVVGTARCRGLLEVGAEQFGHVTAASRFGWLAISALHDDRAVVALGRQLQAVTRDRVSG